MQEKIEKLRKLKILFVEDEDDIIEIISDTLRRLDVNFVVAQNGKEGLEKFEQNPDINLIVTDINMPIMNGLYMLREIRNLGSDVKCIVMSAHTELQYKNEAKELNIEEYIIKPFDFIEFLDLIARL